MAAGIAGLQPAHSLYARLKAEGRLTRPKHWLDFARYKMSHAPLKMTIAEAHEELDNAWRRSYSPQRNKHVTDVLTAGSLNVGAMHFLMRLFFRGIYVPQMTKRAWLNLIFQNRRSIFKLLRTGVQNTLRPTPPSHATTAVSLSTWSPSRRSP
jgi:hypothetical protein